MNGIAIEAPYSYGSFPNLPSGGRITESALGRLSTQYESNAEIQIVTSEGDTVQFSARAREEASFTVYDARGRYEGGTFGVSSRSREFFSDNEINITVQGDLNEEEREDIRRILNSLGEMIEGFLDNDDDDDGEAVALPDPSELETITSLDVSLDVSTAVQAEQMITVTRSERGPSEQEHGDDSADHDEDSRKGLDDLIGGMLKAVDKFEDKTQRFAEKMPKFMMKLLDKLGERSGFEPRKHDLAKQVVAGFLKRLDELSGPANEEEHAQTLAAPPSRDQSPGGLPAGERLAERLRVDRSATTGPNSELRFGFEKVGTESVLDIGRAMAAEPVETKGAATGEDHDVASLSPEDTAFGLPAESFVKPTPEGPSEDAMAAPSPGSLPDSLRFGADFSRLLSFDYLSRSNARFQLYQPSLSVYA